MSVFPSWPWTNFHEENLDWVISQVKKLFNNASQLVSEYFSDHIDDTLTNPDKAAQAKASGDAIRANTAQISSVNTSLSNSIAGVDATVQALNSRYLRTVGDVNALTTRVSNAETNISDLDDADEALSDRITALESATGIVKDYVFSIHEYTGSNDPLYVCTMEDSPNTLNSLLSDLDGRIPVNAKAIIDYNGMTSSRLANLTTVRVGGEIHGIEFDAGDFHCRLLDSNALGTAYFNKVYISLNRTTGVVSLTKGDCMSIKHFTPQITINHSNDGSSYTPIYIDRSDEQHYVKLWYLEHVEDVSNLGSVCIQVNVDDSVQVN